MNGITTYPTSAPLGIPGAPADMGAQLKESMIAQEGILGGMGLVRELDMDNECRLPLANICTITDSAGTYTAGAIVVTVNGFTATAAYDTNKDTTMTALAAAIQALNSVETAVYTAGSHTIVITAVANEALTVSVDITGITGNMTITSTLYSCTETLIGLSAWQHGGQEMGYVGVVVNDKAVITLSGDAMAASDTLIVTLNGTTLATITYATSEAATLRALAELIQAQPGIVSCSVDTTARSITILANYGLALKVNSVAVHDETVASVALAATITEGTQNTAAGVAYYHAMDMVPVGYRGRFVVLVEEAVTRTSPVYVRFRAKGVNTLRGSFRASTDTDAAVLWAAARYVLTAAAGGLSIVELNLP